MDFSQSITKTISFGLTLLKYIPVFYVLRCQSYLLSIEDMGAILRLLGLAWLPGLTQYSVAMAARIIPAYNFWLIGLSINAYNIRGALAILCRIPCLMHFKAELLYPCRPCYS
jgi:hypothetical protein